VGFSIKSFLTGEIAGNNREEQEEQGHLPGMSNIENTATDEDGLRQQKKQESFVSYSHNNRPVVARLRVGLVVPH
jgi:hypothetical protein